MLEENGEEVGNHRTTYAINVTTTKNAVDKKNPNT